MASTNIQTRTRPNTDWGARRGADRGFTLIEMAIAVAIFGLLASGAIMATSAWLGKQALDKTAKNLDRIESALTVYMVQNGALPCPYNNAVSPPTALNCAGAGNVFVGIVPYRILGLQRADVLDGWNRYITYAVDPNWSDAAGQVFFNGTSLYRLSDLTPTGAALRVQDAGGTDCSTPPTLQSACAAYVLISHGEDGNGAFINFNGVQRAVPGAGARAEAANSDIGADVVFAAEAYTTPPVDNQFDHILRFRTPGQILRDAY